MLEIRELRLLMLRFQSNYLNSENQHDAVSLLPSHTALTRAPEAVWQVWRSPYQSWNASGATEHWVRVLWIQVLILIIRTQVRLE